MICAWESLLSVLPQRLKQEVDKQGAQGMQELRLRVNAPPELVFYSGSKWLSGRVTQEELHGVVNAASRYSPWSAATISQGYVTAPGGHRIGLCGETVCKNGRVEGVRVISSLCIRVARDFPGIAQGAERIKGSALIIGPPGRGKTTFLRDLIRNISKREAVAVVDERGELFPSGFERGAGIDILTGCAKAQGIQMLLRTMGPGCIAVDEITQPEDAREILFAANCGVRLLATAHAGCAEDLKKRPIYRELMENQVFSSLLVINEDRSYRMEGVPS